MPASAHAIYKCSFDDNVGLSPKQLLRVTRFQRALRIARSEPALSWGRVAHLAGFYDHAHLIHDSNDIAGCTPSEWLHVTRV